MNLPLFPVRTVLFPRAPVRLRVFEHRYKAMMARCIDEEAPFGVVLIRRGQEADGPLPDTHSVGCSARIARAVALGNGDMDIDAVGTERFRILSLNCEHSHLVGRVEPLQVESVDTAVMAHTGRHLRLWVERYLKVLSEASREDIEPSSARLPADPLALAYLAASVLPVPASEKQSLLAEQQADLLLLEVYEMYRRELPLLEHVIASRRATLPGPFSRN
jgi:Lon protease-like protein